jgi:uncharacterized cupin superfamily protein
VSITGIASRSCSLHFIMPFEVLHVQLRILPSLVPVEVFNVLEGTVEVMFRGAKSTARPGETVSIPANAPHAFKNVSTAPARLLCTVSPAGEDDFFLEIGDRVPTRTGPLPALDEPARKARAEKAKALSAKYKNEIMTA